VGSGVDNSFAYAFRRRRSRGAGRQESKFVLHAGAFGLTLNNIARSVGLRIPVNPTDHNDRRPRARPEPDKMTLEFTLERVRQQAKA
jgi:hypothetical protein